MLFNLAHPEPFRLEGSPLAAAIAQVRFPLLAQLQDLAGVAPFQREVFDFFPYMEPVHQQQIAVVVGPLGPSVPPTADHALAWKFTDDEGWTLSLEAGGATLSIGANYTGVEAFTERWRAALRALASVRAPRCDRLSVRYVDVVTIGEADAGTWRAWFHPELVGWLNAGILGPEASARICVTQSHIVLGGGDSVSGYAGAVQGLIRHGLVPIDTNIAVEPLSPPMSVREPAFLLDVDLFVEAHQPFDVDELTLRFSGLHGQALAFFWWSLTEAGKQHFGVVKQ